MCDVAGSGFELRSVSRSTARRIRRVCKWWFIKSAFGVLIYLLLFYLF